MLGLLLLMQAALPEPSPAQMQQPAPVAAASPSPVPALSPLLPQDWSALPPLRTPREWPPAARISAFVRDEVNAGRCPPRP